MSDFSVYTCPFCSEPDFDGIGLKHHLLSGYCDVFNSIETVEEERKRKKETK